MGLINILNIPEGTFLRKSSSGGLGLLCFEGFVFLLAFLGCYVLFGFVCYEQQTLQIASA